MRWTIREGFGAKIDSQQISLGDVDCCIIHPLGSDESLVQDPVGPVARPPGTFLSYKSKRHIITGGAARLRAMDN
jgi:hypothetical protein